jgi:hypothetical protein
VGVLNKHFHLIVARLYLLPMDQWKNQPLSQQSSTHGGTGFVDDVNQRNTPLVNGSNQFQIPRSKPIDPNRTEFVDAGDLIDVIDVIVVGDG